MRVDDFDYELPEELIAQKPLKERDSCRLMVLHNRIKNNSSTRDSDSLGDNSNNEDQHFIEHRKFSDILEYLHPGDCLVLNDSRVIPARLFGVKEGTGAKIEFLLIKRVDRNAIDNNEFGGLDNNKASNNSDGFEFWETMVRPGRRLRPGDRVIFSNEPGKKLVAEIIDNGEDGTRIVSFDYDGIFMERLEEIGAMPLPPYIDRPATEEDAEDYQTVYNRYEGSVAAPTAGLHFTEELLKACETKGVKLAYLTLHVGIGTFRPVKAETVEDHHMHFEEYTVSEEAAKTINETIKSGGRIISVGTTSTRTLESAAVAVDAVNTEVNDSSKCSSCNCSVSEGNQYKRFFIKPGSGSTNIFIYPGYNFKIVDGLITNFHLPKSTLIMLISALAGREDVLIAYKEAVKEKYRFFSYGDAMLII